MLYEFLWKFPKSFIKNSSICLFRKFCSSAKEVFRNFSLNFPWIYPNISFRSIVWVAPGILKKKYTNYFECGALTATAVKALVFSTTMQRLTGSIPAQPRNFSLRKFLWLHRVSSCLPCPAHTCKMVIGGLWTCSANIKLRSRLRGG